MENTIEDIRRPVASTTCRPIPVPAWKNTIEDFRRPVASTTCRPIPVPAWKKHYRGLQPDPWLPDLLSDSRACMEKISRTFLRAVAPDLPSEFYLHGRQYRRGQNRGDHLPSDSGAASKDTIDEVRSVATTACHPIPVPTWKGSIDEVRPVATTTCSPNPMPVFKDAVDDGGPVVSKTCSPNSVITSDNSQQELDAFRSDLSNFLEIILTEQRLSTHSEIDISCLSDSSK
ncbi:hypothetical protein AVEN_185871-1 [Araneus ventricosus]|uniref:Uncharacterized protein n=1 Tax=Araneus ventricosus TaxID=182803 RepID=A0A4Y2WT43_ARAVE|nr:hypothetical protein AVEN_185871-1 [Araneus ventricosus]